MDKYEMKSFRVTKANLMTVTLNNGSKYKVENPVTIKAVRTSIIEQMTFKAEKINFHGEWSFSIPKKNNALLSEHFTAVKIFDKIKKTEAKAKADSKLPKPVTTKKPPGHGKKVMCVENGMVFNSIGDAAKSIGVTSSAVSTVVRGVYPHVKQLHFVFVKGK